MSLGVADEARTFLSSQLQYTSASCHDTCGPGKRQHHISRTDMLRHAHHSHSLILSNRHLILANVVPGNVAVCCGSRFPALE